MISINKYRKSALQQAGRFFYAAKAFSSISKLFVQELVQRQVKFCGFVKLHVVATIVK